MSKRPIREQLFIEQDVQLSLIMRAVLYGAACMTYFTVIQFFTKASTHPGTSTWETILSLTDEGIYWVPGFFLLGPLMVYDMLRITNRVVGPIFAMRRQMRLISQGEEGRQLKFRNDDYWDSLAIEFNTVRDEVIRLRLENARLHRESETTAEASQDEVGSEEMEDAVVPR